MSIFFWSPLAIWYLWLRFCDRQFVFLPMAKHCIRKRIEFNKAIAEMLPVVFEHMSASPHWNLDEAEVEIQKAMQAAARRK